MSDPSFSQCLHALQYTGGGHALTRLNKLLESNTLTPEQGAALIDAAVDMAPDRSHKSASLAKAVADSGCFAGVDLHGLDPNPLTRILKLAKGRRPEPLANLPLWADIAIAIGSGSAMSETQCIRLFELFLSFPHPSALKNALSAGACLPPPPAALSALIQDSCEALGGGSSLLKARLRLETLVSAGFKLPAMDPMLALDYLSTCCPMGAKRALCEALIERAAPALDSAILDGLAECCVNKKGGDGASLGSILKAPQWLPETRAVAAHRLCKKSIEIGAPTGFIAAASFCAWSAFAPKAIVAFGASFVAQLEREALRKVSAQAEPLTATSANPPARARL